MVNTYTLTLTIGKTGKTGFNHKLKAVGQWSTCRFFSTIEPMKKRRIKWIICVSLCLATMSLLFAGGGSEQTTGLSIPAFLTNNVTASAGTTAQTEDGIGSDMATLERLYRYVDSQYLYDIDRQKAFDNMAKALLDSLDDDFSYYITSEYAEDFMAETSGTYGGIGTYLTKYSPDRKDPENPETWMVKIISPFPGAPAERAGLRSGDLISHIDGEPVDDLTATESSKALKGAPGTAVTVTVHRGNSVFDLTLKREVINTPTTENGILEGGYGYLRIYEFTNKTAQQASLAIDSFNKAKVQGIIIDLRNNGGGIIDSALSIADMFIQDRPLITINHKDNVGDVRYIASDSIKVAKELPVVVLVNAGSASSSEILAGILKGDDRATLIGTTTYGKGITQIAVPFAGGVVQVTNAKYLLPNGEDIHKIGIEPHIFVEAPEVPEDQLPAFEKLMDDQAIYRFADEHPEYSDANIQLFVREHAEYGLDSYVMSLLMRNEYLARMDYDDRPVADPVYDLQLKRAIDYLNTGN